MYMQYETRNMGRKNKFMWDLLDVLNPFQGWCSLVWCIYQHMCWEYTNTFKFVFGELGYFFPFIILPFLEYVCTC